MTSPEPSDTGPTGASRPWVLRWWVSAAAGTAGVVVGVVAAALLGVGGQAGPAGADDGGSPSSSASATVSGPGGELVLDPLCLQAFNAAEDALAALDGAGQAAEDLDAARLDEIVRTLQPVQARLRAGVTGCGVTARRPGATTAPSTTPAPAPGDPTPTGPVSDGSLP